MTASPQIRAKRRFDEFRSKGDHITMEEVLKNIEDRDHIDQTRKESPLRKADDAITLDNSNFSLEEQLDWAVQKAEEIINSNES
jgi:cytidylate kinase